MNRYIAYCGLDCTTCLIFKATLETDKSQKKKLREKIQKICNEEYDMHLQLEDITDCDGCNANSGWLFSGCSQCEIRKCVIAKELKSCAYCEEYACEKLREFFTTDPEAKKNLEKIRNNNIQN